MMTTLHTSYAPIIGCSPSTRNCYIHRHGTMQRGLVKRTGPAMDWLEYQLILAAQKIEASCVWFQIHRLDWRHVLCGYVAGLVSCPLGFFGSSPIQRKEDEYRAANPSWVDQDDVPDDIRQQWQEAQANRRMQFKVNRAKYVC